MNNKRPYNEPHGSNNNKRHKDSYHGGQQRDQQRDHHSRGYQRDQQRDQQCDQRRAQYPHSTQYQQGPSQGHSARDRPRKEVDYYTNAQRLPPPDSAKADVPAYTPFTVAKNLPPLPEISDPKLADSPFRHKSSAHGYDRTSTTSDLTYERLEFLGDAYLELVASRLIFHHFSELQAGAQSQVRELLVKNETLSEYARLYGFQDRVKVADMESMCGSAKDRGNKGLNKILGDVFEAYIAAIVLSDPEHGLARAEAWLTALWAPKLIEAAASHKHTNASLALQSGDSADPRSTYNPTAKADLQKKIQAHGAKLVYAPYKDSVELKGDQLGQNRHYIAIHLTGYGYENKLLGQGEGKNKVEAGNWAAMEAMHGGGKEVVAECEAKLSVIREEKQREKDAAAAAAEAAK